MNWKIETKKRTQNILNLGKGQFVGEGIYDIPKIKGVKALPKIEKWIGFNEAKTEKHPEDKAIHFFIDDYQFERVWNRPEAYIELFKRFVCIATPDFSPYGDMPLATQIYNMYRRNWVGAYFENEGIKVVPTIRASTDKRSLRFYLDGIPEDSHVIMSNMWTKSQSEKEYFYEEFDTLQERKHPRKVFIYGKPMELWGNVEYLKKFTERRFDGKSK